MIHLSGKDKNEKIERALWEIEVYDSVGLDGAIIEDYHGTFEEVKETLRQSKGKFEGLIKGVNILSNPYLGFKVARDYGAKFVQFDSVQTPDLCIETYNLLRLEFQDILVLGGIGFKYTKPTGRSLELDLIDGKSRCEAIVTTGEGTGIETSIEKLREYKRFLRDFPLIVGAGVNDKNICDQLRIADGSIVGSYLKPNGDTRLPIEVEKVSRLNNLLNSLRRF